jgi:probable addiction module antidote protein
LVSIEVSDWNVLDYLGSEDDMAAYLQAAMLEEGPAGFMDAAADVMKARALLKLSRETGMPYRELRQMFSDSQGEEPEAPSNEAIRKIGEALSAPV